jgi:hypothetical protein
MRGRTAGSASDPILKTGEPDADTVVVQSQDGTAAVVGGALVVVPPAHDGRRAVVCSEPGIDLIVPGGESGHGPVEASTAADIEVRLPDDAPSLDIRVEIASDQLLATMSVERVPGARYRLEDQPPNHSITLRRLVAGRIACPEPSLDDLYSALADRDVVYGVLSDAVDRLCHGGFNEPVARGVAPVRAEDATTQLHALDARGGERYVRAGALLARISPARPGLDGVTVTGHVIGVGDPRPAELRVGDGAIVESDGRIVATLDGHARLTDGVVTVTAALVHAGDVRASSGELSSPGSIEVTGSVEDGLVRAKRSVLVGDAVRRSTIEAGHALEIRGPAFDSTLRIGHTHAAMRALHALTAPLARDVGRVQNGMNQLVAATRAAGRDLPPLRMLAMVFERVAPELEQKIKGALAEADRDRGSVPYDVLAALRAAQDDLEAIRVGRLPMARLAGVAAAFEQETSHLHDLTAEAPAFTVSLLQMCAVDMIGTMVVTGKGIIESTLRVRGRLELRCAGAVMRGGHLLLDGTAVVHELAPGTGAGLTVSLAPGSVLEASVVHPGVRVELPGGDVRRLESLATDVRVAADPVAA